MTAPHEPTVTDYLHDILAAVEALNQTATDTLNALQALTERNQP